MKNILLPAIFCLICFSCNESNSLTSLDDLNADKIIIVDSLNLSTFKKDKLKVLEQNIIGDILTLKVQYGGGCKEHEIKVYSLKSIIKTNPPQFELFISHNANNDGCMMLITKEYNINLRDLKLFYKSHYNNVNILILDIYEPGSNVPVSPLLKYFI